MISEFFSCGTIYDLTKFSVSNTSKSVPTLAVLLTVKGLRNFSDCAANFFKIQIHNGLSGQIVKSVIKIFKID